MYRIIRRAHHFAVATYDLLKFTNEVAKPITILSCTIWALLVVRSLPNLLEFRIKVARHTASDQCVAERER